RANPPSPPRERGLGSINSLECRGVASPHSREEPAPSAIAVGSPHRSRGLPLDECEQTGIWVSSRLLIARGKRKDSTDAWRKIGCGHEVLFAANWDGEFACGGCGFLLHGDL